MNIRLPFRHLQPVLYAGLFDDPLLVIGIRPTGKSLLFDCGQLQHMAKRVLKSLSAVFVSHAHMDHFMGFDTLVRNVHVSPRTVEIFGPAGIAGKTGHKLAAYDWNLTEDSWCSFRVREIMGDRTSSFLFPGAEGFVCRQEEERVMDGSLIFQNDHLRVEAFPGDHKIPSLFFRITEKPSFAIDGEKMAAAGLVTGEWLGLLKKRLWSGQNAESSIDVLRRHGDSVEQEPVRDLRGLYEQIQLAHHPASIGYVSDIGFSEQLLRRMIPTLRGVTLLICECSFLARDRDKARISHHLCTTDLNLLVEQLSPSFVMPMHLSKSYTRESHLLYEELSFPSGTTLIRLPDRVAPRPLLMEEVVNLLKPKQARRY